MRADGSKFLISLSALIVAKQLFSNSVSSLRSLSAMYNSTSSTRAETTELPTLQSLIPDSSTGNVFNGEKIRDFSLPRANLRKTRHSTELPFENDFKNKCTKWGVVSTMSGPTEAVSRVSNLIGWCLVVVADAKTPTDYLQKLEAIGGSVEHTTFLFSVEHQKRWEHLDGPVGEFVQTIPWGHFGRKNLGYLFAILHGAEFVFDFDDDNNIKLDNRTGKPVDILPSTTTLDNVTVALVGPTIFNHHPIMKPSTLAPTWARGFPLEHKEDKAMEGQAVFQKSIPFVSRSSSIGVIQLLADGNPDVDAIHRQTTPLPITFENTANATSVLVPKHSYSPYNSQASIHTKPALWATLLPSTVPGRVSDIWRSYFAQCIFADSNLRIVFAPPKIERTLDRHNILVDSKTAENDLYIKSGKLLDFLSRWDSDHLYLPERVEQLWIDLYERSYIELDDVIALQKWLEVLLSMGYIFPEPKPRYRNVAVMGQFNFADFPNIMTQILVWSQQMRERFQTVLVAAPFSDSQLASLAAHWIDTIQAEQRNLKQRTVLGYYNPMSNLMKTLLKFENSSTIEAVLYVHDDALLNLTDLTGGKYPFDTSKIIANRKTGTDNAEYVNLRTIPDREKAKRQSHRVFPNGTISDVDKTIFVNTPNELRKHIQRFHDDWKEWRRRYCSAFQTNLAMDPEFAKYLDPDGSAWFPYHTQADFLMVPTKYATAFAEVASLHLKHKIWIECAFGKIVDILQHHWDAPVRLVKLCTAFGRKRGQWNALMNCRSEPVAVFHPFKISDRYDVYWAHADEINFQVDQNSLS